MAAVFIVRIDDEHAQLFSVGETFLDQHRDRRRLADAGRADDGEMAADEFAHADDGWNAGVLRQAADLDAFRAAEGVDGRQIAGADAMGDGAEARVGLNAAKEPRLALLVVDDGAGQFDLHMGDIAFRLAPEIVGGRQLADHAHEAGLFMHDRDEMADGPVFARAIRADLAGDQSVHAVQRHEMAKNGRAPGVPPLMQLLDRVVRPRLLDQHF